MFEMIDIPRNGVLQSFGKCEPRLPSEQPLRLIIRCILMRYFETVRLHYDRFDIFLHGPGYRGNDLDHGQRSVRREIEGFAEHTLVHALREQTVRFGRVADVQVIPHGRLPVADNGRLIVVQLVYRPRHEAGQFQVARAVEVCTTSNAYGYFECLVKTLCDKVRANLRYLIRVGALQVMYIFCIRECIVLAVCLVGRCNDDLLDASALLCRLEYIPRSLDIRFERRERIVERLIDNGLRGKVEDDLDFELFDDVFQERKVAHVAFNDSRFRPEVALFEYAARIILVDEYHGPRAPANKQGGQVAAQKTVGPGDEYILILPKVFHGTGAAATVAYSRGTQICAADAHWSSL